MWPLSCGCLFVPRRACPATGGGSKCSCGCRPRRDSCRRGRCRRGHSPRLIGCCPRALKSPYQDHMLRTRAVTQTRHACCYYGGSPSPRSFGLMFVPVRSGCCLAPSACCAQLSSCFVSMPPHQQVVVARHLDRRRRRQPFLRSRGPRLRRTVAPPLHVERSASCREEAACSSARRTGQAPRLSVEAAVPKCRRR